MPRITLDLDDGVLRELKARCARENKSLGVIASVLLARVLGQEAEETGDLVWVSQAMGAKVDLEPWGSIWAALDRDWSWSESM